MWLAVVFQSKKLNLRGELEVEDREGRNYEGDLFSLCTLVQFEIFTVYVLLK